MNDGRPLRRLLWERHTNQWSVWMLVATYPALIAALYRRSLPQFLATLLLVPLGVLPFRPARHDRAWATRVVLGEQVWMRERTLASKEMLLTAGSVPVHLFTFASALRQQRVRTLLGVAASMTLMLVFFELMANVYERSRASEA